MRRRVMSGLGDLEHQHTCRPILVSGGTYIIEACMKNWFLWLVGAAIVIALLDNKSNNAPSQTRSTAQTYQPTSESREGPPQLSAYPVESGVNSGYSIPPYEESEPAQGSHPDPSYRHPQSSNRIGNATFYTDGTTAQRIGDATFYSDGTTAQRIGDSTFYSDGTTAQRIGDATFYSDGTTAQRIGDATFYSDGTTCQTIGDSTFCN